MGKHEYRKPAIERLQRGLNVFSELSYAAQNHNFHAKTGHSISCLFGVVRYKLVPRQLGQPRTYLGTSRGLERCALQHEVPKMYFSSSPCICTCSNGLFVHSLQRVSDTDRSIVCPRLNIKTSSMQHKCLPRTPDRPALSSLLGDPIHFAAVNDRVPGTAPWGYMSGTLWYGLTHQSVVCSTT